MKKGHEHDILATIGMPLMLLGSIVTLKTNSTKAAYIALIGATMNISWAVVDILIHHNREQN